jgi:two-component system alkaline phosphatase synthesis response regulator PhoP
MGKKITVLVIDDEEHILNLFRCHPSLDEFKVAVAGDGYTGLEIARRVKPDVILLDWIMPEMDGMEVLSKLKKDAATKNIPVFMLTAKRAPSDVGTAICEGVDGYFAKPFDIVQLVQTLSHKLENPVNS